MTVVGLIALLSLMSVGGLCLAVSGWLPPAPSLTRTMRHLRRPSSSLAGGRPGDGGAANWLATTMSRYPCLLPTDVQLRLVGRSRARHAARLGVVVLGGLIVPGLLVEVLQLTDVIGVQWFVPLALSLLCSAVGALVVHTTTIERAATVRTDLRYQLSAYLDVVTMLLAGNTGYEGALEQASRAGDGRFFAEVRRRMREAAARGASLTDALQHTGVDLGLEELEQVAATAALSAA
jgi:hypothetical protein